MVRSITGHVIEPMTEHYSHVEPEEKHRATNAVVQLIGVSAARSGLSGGTSRTEPNEKTS